MAHYFDTSALAKLVIEEPETEALRAWLAEQPRQPVACDLVRTELMRAVRRVAPDRITRVRQVLDGLTLTEVTSAIFEAAGRLDPVVLRSFDAIHLAAALDLGDELEGLVTDDTRLAESAEVLGVAALAPT